jgi:perosamine synthetase
MNIRLFKPSVGKEELEKIEQAFDRSWIGLGPVVNEFEKEWSKFVGVEEAIGLNSATAALHIAVRLFDFPKGKKVLVPAMTFAASVTAILYNNLIPVFVDSNKETMGMDIEDLKMKYDSDCVAVIPVHFAGHPVEMEELMTWSKKMGLKVIEDCAHTSGALYKGKALGTWGDIGCYSFEEKKLMTTGDGGMIVSNNPDLLKDVRAYRWIGIDKDNWKTAKAYTDSNPDAMHWFYEINLLGYKYNMNDLSASIGMAQLKKLPAMNKRRSVIISRYIEGLKGVKGVELLLPFEPDVYVYQMFGIRAEARDNLMIYLKSKGIATGCHYTPMTKQPLFKEYEGHCPVAEEESDKFITLPLHADLTNEEVDYIIEHIRKFNDSI